MSMLVKFGYGRHHLKFAFSCNWNSTKKVIEKCELHDWSVNLNLFASERGLNIFWSFEPDVNRNIALLMVISQKPLI